MGILTYNSAQDISHILEMELQVLLCWQLTQWAIGHSFGVTFEGTQYVLKAAI